MTLVFIRRRSLVFTSTSGSRGHGRLYSWPTPSSSPGTFSSCRTRCVCHSSTSGRYSSSVHSTSSTGRSTSSTGYGVFWRNGSCAPSSRTTAGTSPLTSRPYLDFRTAGSLSRWGSSDSGVGGGSRDRRGEVDGYSRGVTTDFPYSSCPV